ncbi:MAG TPA: endolytic transglycosylase MltG [Acidimicrobiales bacterium]
MNVLAPYDLDDDDAGFREGRGWPWILLGTLVAVLLVLAAGGIWIKNQVNPPGAPGDVVRIRVEDGMSVSEIGDLLEREGVIKSATVWKYYVKLNGSDNVEAGEFTLHKNESMGTVVDVLAGGAVSTREQIPLTVPEGLTLEKIAQKVGEMEGRSAERFLEIARSGQVRSQYSPPGNNNLEGLILPETYFFEETDDEADILRRMVESFDRTVTELGIANAASRLKVTPYEAVVIASMVEREAKVPEDRGPIARVIYNRLEREMPLQIDATVLYALRTDKNFVTFADREVNSPYNTYKIDRLPPGPIAAPGRAALEATLSPPPGPWIFYVLIEENGKHAFSTTLEEFNRHVAEATRKGLVG